MIGRIISFVVGLTAMAVSAGVLIVSASFALYALLRTYVGPSGAAACLALVAAVVVGGLALMMFGKAKVPKRKAGSASDVGDGLVGKVTSLVSGRPVVAATAAVAAGLLAWRNPAVVSTLLRMMDARPGTAAKRR